MEEKTKDLELQVIEACKKDDPRAQKALYDRYCRAMFNICMRMLGDRDVAQDALQEAFVHAFKNLEKFEGRSTFGAWLKRIVINKCINELNRKKLLNWEQVPEVPTEDVQESTEEAEMTIQLIEKAIQELPTGCRTVFTMKHLEGFDHNEIASFLRITVSTSKTQLARAKKLLRVHLTQIAQS